MSKLVLDLGFSEKYDKSELSRVVRAICNQVNTLSEGRMTARYQAQASVPSSVAAAVGDVIWDSNATVTSGSVRMGWICTVSSPTNATFQEMRVLNSVPAAVTAAATQSDQETATSTSTFVSPGRQHFHPSAAKAWANVTMSGGTPTLQSSYNITSITDAGTGLLTITIATDFSSANWSAVCTLGQAGIGTRVGNADIQSATSVQLVSADTSSVLADPPAWCFAGFGDQ